MVYSAVWIKSFSSSPDARVSFRHFVRIPYIVLIAPDRGTFQIVEGLKHLFKVYLSVGIHAYRPQKTLANRMHGIYYFFYMLPSIYFLRWNELAILVNL